MNLKIPEIYDGIFDPYRFKVFYGGRGSSKSWTVAQGLLFNGYIKPLRILCTREIQRSIKDSVKLLLDDMIRLHNLENFYSSTQNEIKGANGTLFLFLGLKHNTQEIKSTEGIDICWTEEAERASQESLDILIPTIRKPGSELWFTYNPNNKNAPVHKMFQTNRADALVKKINYNHNPWFPEELEKERQWWLKNRRPEEYRHVWEGEILERSDALVFRNWRIDRFEAPEETIFYQGADWGFSTDPTTLIRIFIDDNKRRLYVDFEAYGIGVEIDHIHSLFRRVPESNRWKIIADSARPETISYLKRHGYNIIGAKKGAGSVEDGIEFLKNYEIIVHERCTHTIDELATYSYKIDKRTDNILPILDDKKNHVIDALRYALEGVRRKTIQPRIRII